MTAEATDRVGSQRTAGDPARLDRMVANIIYGSSIPGDAELRLCGDTSEGRRAVELGVSQWFNSLEFAHVGAKAIAVDPDPERIAELRRRADDAEVVVQCLTSELADLGDITSATCDVVLAARSLSDVDDLGRLLRQVHRILKPTMPFVISLPHPYSSVSESHPYGTSERTVSDWFTSLGRANFRVDQLRELGVDPTHSSPTTLVLRARKEGI
jgi:SAM-dependent methyltransferase